MTGSETSRLDASSGDAVILAGACARICADTGRHGAPLAGELSLLASGRSFAFAPRASTHAHASSPRLPERLAGLAGARLDGDDTDGGPRHFRASRLICDVVEAALADAGLTRDEIAGPSTGFVTGSYYGCIDFLDAMRAAEHERGPRAVKPTEFAIATQGYPVAALGMTHQAQGPATAFFGGLTAGFEALAFAVAMLAANQCERMVVIGYELPGDCVTAHLRALGGVKNDGAHCLPEAGVRERRSPDTNVAETIVAFVVARSAPDPVAAIGAVEAGFDPGASFQAGSLPPTLGADGLLRLFRSLAEPGFRRDDGSNGMPVEITCADPSGSFAALTVLPLRAGTSTLRENAA